MLGKLRTREMYVDGKPVQYLRKDEVMAALSNPSPETVDKHLDAVLRAAGSGLRHYSMQKTLDEMRTAMRRAMEAGNA